MNIKDWLRDGLLGRKAHFRHSDETRPQNGAWEEFADPSGRHDFGRRAHHPDPHGHYAFGEDPTHRMTPPHHAPAGRK